MNKSRFIFATLLVSAIVAIAVVSCKKEATVATQPKDNEVKTAFYPKNVTDMNAYLKGFKKQMQECKDGTTVSLEEATWLLSSIANFDYGYANVSYNDIRFDTIYSHVNVTNGEISLADLNATYIEISSEIEAFQRSINLENHHFHFIGSSIDDNGEVLVCMVSTYGWFDFDDHLWYFSDYLEADSICDEYFDPYTQYYASELGRSELERVLNILESRSTDNTGGRIYYVIQSTKTFKYREHIDPYGSPSYLNSRLFASFFNEDMKPDMCYYLDSYCGLGHEDVPMGNEIINWQVIYEQEPPLEQYHEHLWKATHKLVVNYGVACAQGQENG